jgi:hypothetical protein
MAEGRQGLDLHTARPLATGPAAVKPANEPETKAVTTPQPTRQISLKLESGGAARVNIDLTQKAGRVQVTVRTQDRELTKSLQTDLGDLVGRLETKGFKAETWIPASSRQTASEPSHPNPGQGQPEHSGSGSGHPGQRQEQHGSNQRHQERWAAQMEHILSAKDTRSEGE